METNKLIAGIVAAAIAVIVLAGVLMPALSNATTTEDTYINDGLYYMTDLADQSIVYTFDGTKWTIDGEDSSIAPSDDTTLAAGDEVIIRTSGLIRGKANLTPSVMSITVTATGITGTATVNNVSQSVNISATMYYCAVNDETDYTLSKYNVPTYLHEDSQILADGMAGYKSGSAALFRIEGSIADGFTVTPTPNTLGITDVQCNYEKLDDHIDLYKVTSITFKSVYDNGTPGDTSDDVIRDQTFSSYVVPAKITCERSVHFSDAMNVILNVIPLLIIVAVLLGVVAVFILRRE